MPDMEFNTTAGQTVDRELLVAYLNTGDSSTPVWSPLGTRVTDSSYGIRLAGGLYKGYPGDHQNQHEKADHHTEL